MSERSAPADTLFAGAPLRLGSVTVLPIERIVRRSDRGDRGAWFTAIKEPYAVIVREADGTRAFAAGADAVSLEELRALVPELDALLSAL